MYKLKPLSKTIKLTTPLLLAATILLSLHSTTEADTFYPSADGQNCSYAHVTSISYRNLPITCSNENCIDYNPSEIAGESGNYPATHTFNSIAQAQSPGARRFTGVADRVKVPPNTTIDVGFYSSNYSGHTVTVTGAQLFVSRPNPAEGDWGRLGAGGVIGGANYTFLGQNLIRNGRYVDIGPLGSTASHPFNAPPAGRTMYSFTTIQPIRVLSREATTDLNINKDLEVQYKLQIENTSDYQLNEVMVYDDLPDGGSYESTLDFAPHQVREITYSANMGKVYDPVIFNSPARVYDPNRHVESATRAATSTSDIGPDTRTVIVRRSDSGAPAGWAGNQPGFYSLPFGDHNVIELIPYSVFSEVTTVDAPFPGIFLSKLVSDEDEVLVEQNNSKVGDHIAYSISASNFGGVATNVEILDDYVERYIEIMDIRPSSEFPGLTIENDGNTIKWTIPYFQTGQEIEIEVVARIIAKPVEVDGQSIFPNYVEISWDYSEDTIVDSVETIVIDASPNGDTTDGCDGSVCDLEVKGVASSQVVDGDLALTGGYLIYYILISIVTLMTAIARFILLR